MAESNKNIGNVGLNSPGLESLDTLDPFWQGFEQTYVPQYKVSNQWCASENFSLSKSDFVNFLNDSAYGGNQGWYESEGLTYGKNMNNTGCGSIAAANVLMYYAQVDYQGVGSKIYTNPKYIEKKDYILFAEELYHDYVVQTVGWSDFNGKATSSLGVWTISQVSSGIIRYAKKRGVSLVSHTLSNKIFNPLEKAVEFIGEALKGDCPVVLYVMSNSYCDKLSKEEDPIMADLHYVTITKMTVIRRKTMYSDVATGGYVYTDEEITDAQITISTWGKENVISLKELWASDSWGTNSSLAYYTVK